MLISTISKIDPKLNVSDQHNLHNIFSIPVSEYPISLIVCKNLVLSVHMTFIPSNALLGNFETP